MVDRDTVGDLRSEVGAAVKALLLWETVSLSSSCGEDLAAAQVAHVHSSELAALFGEGRGEGRLATVIFAVQIP